MISVAESKNEVLIMGRCCAVPKCSSCNKKRRDLTFHTFPKNKLIRRQWITKIRRDVGRNFQIKDFTTVCSLHFTPQDFKKTLTGRMCLLPSAVPSVFAWTKEKKRRHSPKKRISISKSLATETCSFSTSEEISSNAPNQDHIYCKNQVFITVEENTTTPREDSSNDNLEPNDAIQDDNVCTISEAAVTEISQINMQEDTSFPEENQGLIDKYKSRITEVESLMCSIENVLKSDSLVRFYTGFQNAKLLLAFMEFVIPTAQQLRYDGKKTFSKLQTKINLENELFLFLIRIRLGLFVQDLAFRFGLSISTVSKLIRTWANHLYFLLGVVPMWPSRKQIDKTMPENFKEKYPNTRVILDCTEIKVQQPSSLVTQSKMYSNYKSTCTMKCLIGIAPIGGISFISKLYSGSMSDKEITKESGILDLLEPGDSVMADKGFLIKDLLDVIGVKLNMPPFLSKNPQMTRQDVEDTQAIASLRIHVERAIRKIKENHLFDKPLPLSMSGCANQLWSVACMLTNFQGSLFKT